MSQTLLNQILDPYAYALMPLFLMVVVTTPSDTFPSLIIGGLGANPDNTTFVFGCLYVQDHNVIGTPRSPPSGSTGLLIKPASA